MSLENNKLDLVFLINSASGSTRGRSLIEKLEASQGDLAFKVIAINWPKISEQVAYASSAKLVVLAGGDGTLSSLIPMFVDKNTKLAILPLGTGDDLAKELKRPGDPKLDSVLRLGVQAFKHEAKKLNIWQILDSNSKEKLETFVNYFSLGFSAEVISKFAHRRQSNRFKSKLAQRTIYVLIGLRALRTRLPADIKISSNDKIETTTKSNNLCLIFSNISSWMGCSRVQNSNPSDHLLEGTFAKSIFSYAQMLLAKFLPSLTVNKIGSSNSWRLNNLQTPVVCNRDGEEFIVNSSSISITGFGDLEILGVVRQ